jgi:uncharacterized membrane protein
MRIAWIDILRGIAILLMIPANYSPLWTEPHPLWFRFLASLAAPTFILLSSAMTLLNAHKHSFKYYLQRGTIIIGYGVAVDLLVWNVWPFTSFDVLYLIGFSLPIMYLCYRFKNLSLIVFSAVIFITTPLLQHYFGYHNEALEISLDTLYWPGLTRILESWFIDGWFPLFPWLGYGFCGMLYFRYLSLNNMEITRSLLLFAMLMTLLGLLLLFMPTHLFNNLSNDGILPSRIGFSEIFYPPTIPFIISSLSIFVLLTSGAQKLHSYRISQGIALCGRYSLLIYLLHQAIEMWLVKTIMDQLHIDKLNGYLYALCVFLVIFCIYFMCRIIEWSKKFYRPRNAILIVLLGQ